MENIAEILKDCPTGTKLYSPICGECELFYINEDKGLIETKLKCGRIIVFQIDGRVFDGIGECLLFPSKDNRDWNTFGEPKYLELSKSFVKDVQDTIDAVKKYNLIKKPKFKKGDFIHNRDWTCIYYGVNDNGAIQFFAFIPWDWNRNTSTERYDIRPTEKPKIGIGYINDETRLATEDEKALLLSAIEYKGYVWDEEKLELRKKEHEFKPFDRVLVRRWGSPWCIDIFSHKWSNTELEYECLRANWSECIPYEGNEHLLGTTKNCE